MRNEQGLLARTSWYKSLQLFRWRTLHPFLLTILKAALPVYRRITPLLGIMILTMVATAYIAMLLVMIRAWKLAQLVYVLLLVGLIALAFIFFIVTVCAARPSLRLKNLDYFQEYSKRGVYIIGGIIGFHVLHQILLTHIPFLSTLIFLTPAPCTSLYPLRSVLLIFFALFMCDIQPTVKNIGWAFINAAKMMWYNYPVCLIFFLIISEIYAQFYCFLTEPFVTLILPFVIVIFTHLYVKFLYEEYSLYKPLV